MKGNHGGSFWFNEALFEETAGSWFQSQFAVLGALVLRAGLTGKYIRSAGFGN
jgi:hypothetical protein